MCKHGFIGTQKHTLCTHTRTKKTKASPHTLLPSCLMFHKDKAHVKFMQTGNQGHCALKKRQSSVCQAKDEVSDRRKSPLEMKRESSTNMEGQKKKQLKINPLSSLQVNSGILTPQNGRSEWHCTPSTCIIYIFSNPDTLTNTHTHPRQHTDTYNPVLKKTEYTVKSKKQTLYWILCWTENELYVYQTTYVRNRKLCFCVSWVKEEGDWLVTSIHVYVFFFFF